MGIRAANREYERWLAAQLHGDIVDADLGKKHKKMRDSAFSFLRATYWRWAEMILDICPDLANTPAVLAVGDIHLENFGTWRDEEGRLIWGVNDYDETPRCPTSSIWYGWRPARRWRRPRHQISLKAICTNILEGYEHGIEAPEAFVLDRQHMWLRKRFMVGEAERAKFWQKIENQYHDLLRKKHPEHRRRAGSNYSPWRCRNLRSRSPIGGTPPVPAASAARAGSAMAAGAAARCCANARRWCRPDGRAYMATASACGSTTSPRGRYRAPDPWYTASGNLLMRRLSPNNRKIDVEDRRDAARLLHPDLLWAMGRDLAAMHLGVRDRRDALRKDLEKRKRRWFRTHVEAATEFVAREYAEWKKSAK